MTLDSTIATQITALKAKWDAATGENAAINGGGGSVFMLFPVDKTSVIPVKVSGRVIRLLGITKDETPTGFKYFARPTGDYTRKDNNRATIPDGGSIPITRTGFYRVFVNLKSSIAYKRRAKTVQLQQVTINVPYVVPIAGVMCFLYNHASSTLRPPSFETVNKTYRVVNVAYTSDFLGEKSNKSEKPESEQTSEGGGSAKNNSKK